MSNFGCTTPTLCYPIDPTLGPEAFISEISSKFLYYLLSHVLSSWSKTPHSILHGLLQYPYSYFYGFHKQLLTF